MPVLKENVKLFIVQQLACYDTPSQVVETVKEVFDIEVSRPQIQAYDPYKLQGKDLSQKYIDIFNETRKAFLEKTAGIPIASKSFRLRALQRSYDYFVTRKNYVAANQVLEQAAKEEGGFYTNRVKLSDGAGNPLLLLYQQIQGTSMPIVEDVEDALVIENPPQEQPKKSKKVTFEPKNG